MDIKGKTIEIALMGILKWFAIIIFAGIILYLVTPKYELVREGVCFNKITGRLHKVKDKR